MTDRLTDAELNALVAGIDDYISPEYLLAGTFVVRAIAELRELREDIAGVRAKNVQLVTENIALVTALNMALPYLPSSHQSADLLERRLATPMAHPNWYNSHAEIRAVLAARAALASVKGDTG